VFACLRLAASRSEKNELSKISQFLAQQTVSEGPERDLELIESSKASLAGIVTHSILTLNDASDCNQGKIVARLSKYLASTEDQRLLDVLRHAAKVYFDRCRSGYESRLANAFSQISEKQQENMLSVLSDELIADVHACKSQMVEDVMPPSEAGHIFNNSLSFIMDSARSQLSIKDSDFQQLKNRFAVGKFLAGRLGKSCPAYYLNSRSIVEEMRQLIMIVDPVESTTFTGSSHSFRANVFRFKLCEDVSRIRNSAKMMSIIKNSLSRQHIKFEDGSLERNRRMVSFLLVFGGTVAGMILLIVFAFALDFFVRIMCDPKYQRTSLD